MASSRKSRPKLEPLEQALLDGLTRALSKAAVDVPGRPLLIALSGGADSTALIACAARLGAAKHKPFNELIAVHVHHGLQPQADAWAQHCEALCAQLGVPFELCRVSVVARGQGVEAAAREARYLALNAVAREHKARYVLTAHHLDDRIETFLINWLRGAGIDGLASYPLLRPLGEGDVSVVRPWFDVPRSRLRAYIEQRDLPFVEDPSNRNTRLLRNALRLNVLLAIEAARPGFRSATARSIDLAADAADVLQEFAAQDLAYCADGAPEAMLRLDRLSALSEARKALVLRTWLARAGIQAPSRVRLQEALRQTQTARSDARLLLRFARGGDGAVELRRHRGLLLLRTIAEKRATPRGTVRVHWQGKDEVPVPQWGGSLRFVPVQGEGFDPDWLATGRLQLRARTGGERFKPYANRPSRTLKRLFQDAKVPEYERAALPLIWCDDTLIFVAGLGGDVRCMDADGPRVQLQWVPDTQLIESASASI